MWRVVVVIAIICGFSTACNARNIDPLLKAAVKAGKMSAATAFAADEALAVTEEVPEGLSVPGRARHSILDYPGLPLLQEPAQIEKSYGLPLAREPNCKVAGLEREGGCLTYEFSGQEGKTSRQLLILDGRVMAALEAAMPLDAPSRQFPISECSRITQIVLASLLSSFGIPEMGLPLRHQGMGDQQGNPALISTEATWKFADGSAVWFSQIISINPQHCSVATVYFAPGLKLTL